MTNQNCPLVSILIPCYNAEKWIDKAIQSALSQTYGNIEVLVMDDGSTDGSLDIIKSYGDRIKWQTGPNRGGNFARNRLLEVARGDYIQFLDADDWLFPNKIKSQMEIQLDEEYIDTVFSDYEIWDENGNTKLEEIRFNWDSQDYLLLLITKSISTIGPLHRKKRLIEIGGFREALPCAQEYEMHLRLALSGAKFKYLPGLSFALRRVPGSVSSNRVRMAIYRPKIVWPIYRELERTGRLTEEISMLFSQSIYDLAGYLIGLGGHYRDALLLLEDARKMHPSGGVYGSKLRVCLSKVIGRANAIWLINVVKNKMKTNS